MILKRRAPVMDAAAAVECSVRLPGPRVELGLNSPRPRFSLTTGVPVYFGDLLLFP